MQKGKIGKAIERYPAFSLILNYIHNRNRTDRGRAFKDMVAEADNLTNGRRYLEQHIFSTFLADKYFYSQIMAETGLSKNTVQRYLGAFCKIGNLKILYIGRNKGTLYADGWFRKTPNNKLRKFSFMKNSPKIKEGLLKLPALIREYQGYSKYS